MPANLVDEGLFYADAFVGEGPECVMEGTAVEEPDGDAFSFGDFDGGDEVGVAGEDGDIGDLVFGGEEDYVDAEEDIDHFLFVVIVALGVGATAGEFAKADFEAGEVVEGFDEVLGGGEALGFFLGWGGAFVGEAVVVVGAEGPASGIDGLADGGLQAFVADAGVVEFIAEDFINVAAVDEGCDLGHGIFSLSPFKEWSPRGDWVTKVLKYQPDIPNLDLQALQNARADTIFSIPDLY